MWRHQLKDWEKVETEVYRFCYNEASTRLQQTLDEAEKITERAYKLAGILVPLIAICIGILVKQIEQGAAVTFIGCLAAVALIGFFICLYRLWRVVTVRYGFKAGTEPKDLLISDYVENESFQKEEHVKYLHYSTLEIMQDKITRTESQNQARIDHFANALIWGVLMALVALGSLAVIAITSW